MWEWTMGTIRHVHYTIRSCKGANLPGSRLRIAVLADLHNRVYRSDVDSLFEEIRMERCDLILSAGDLVLMKAGHYKTDQALRLVGRLAETLPVYVADGNHETRMKRLYPKEYRRYERSLERAGVVRLHNRSDDADLNGRKLCITGLEADYRCFRNKYHAGLDAEDIRKLVGEPACDRFQILLAHHPKFFPAYAGWGADLTLSGHLHGGIARLPYLGGVISPDPEFFPRYDRGLYKEKNARMIVSAGLGTHTINLRINNPAELVIVELINRQEHSS